MAQLASDNASNEEGVDSDIDIDQIASSELPNSEDFTFSSDMITGNEDDNDTFYPVLVTYICNSKEEEIEKDTLSLHKFAIHPEQIEMPDEPITNIEKLRNFLIDKLHKYNKDNTIQLEIPIKFKYFLKLETHTKYTVDHIERRLNAFINNKARISDSNTMFWNWTPDTQRKILDSNESNYQLVDVLGEKKVMGRAAIITKDTRANDELIGNYHFFQNPDYSYADILKQFLKDCRDAIKNGTVEGEGRYSKLVKGTAELQRKYKWNVEEVLNDIARQNGLDNAFTTYTTKSEELPFVEITGNKLLSTRSKDNSSTRSKDNSIRRQIPSVFEGSVKRTNRVPVQFYRNYMGRSGEEPTICFEFETYIFDYFMNSVNEFWSKMNNATADFETTDNDIYGLQIRNIEEFGENLLSMKVGNDGDVSVTVKANFKKNKAFCMYTGKQQEFYNPEKFTQVGNTETKLDGIEVKKLYDENFKQTYGSNIFKCEVVKKEDGKTTYKIVDKKHDDAMEKIGRELSDKVAQTEKFSRRSFIVADEATLQQLFDEEEKKTGVAFAMPKNIQFPVLVTAPYGFDHINDKVVQIDGQIDGQIDNDQIDNDQIVHDNPELKKSSVAEKLMLVARILYTIRNNVVVKPHEVGLFSTYLTTNGEEVIPIKGPPENMIVPRFKYYENVDAIDFFMYKSLRNDLPYGETPHKQKNGKTFQLYCPSPTLSWKKKQKIISSAIGAYFAKRIDFNTNSQLFTNKFPEKKRYELWGNLLDKYENKYVELNIIRFPFLTIESYRFEVKFTPELKQDIENLKDIPYYVVFIERAPSRYMNIEVGRTVTYVNRKYVKGGSSGESMGTVEDNLTMYGFHKIKDDEVIKDVHRSLIKSVKPWRKKADFFGKGSADAKRLKLSEVMDAFVQLRF